MADDKLSILRKEYDERLKFKKKFVMRANKKRATMRKLLFPEVHIRCFTLPLLPMIPVLIFWSNFNYPGEVSAINTR